MADEIIAELWRIKDCIAHEFGYDVDALIAHLKAQRPSSEQRFVDLHAKRIAEQEHPADSDKIPGR
jgi:hypothetical protein